MRQPHVNIHIKTIEVEHREHTKTIKTQKAIELNTRITLFDILIQRSNNEGFFNANQYNDQATVKDDLADEDHLSDTAGADGKRNEFGPDTIRYDTIQYIYVR